MYHFQWRRGVLGMVIHGLNWTVRGIHEDGSFYGYAKLYSHGQLVRMANIEGCISIARWPHCQELFEKFASLPPLEPSACFGLLATVESKNLSNFQIRFQYNLRDEADSSLAVSFLEIQSILQEEISQSEYYDYLVRGESIPSDSDDSASDSSNSSISR